MARAILHYKCNFFIQLHNKTAIWHKEYCEIRAILNINKLHAHVYIVPITKDPQPKSPASILAIQTHHMLPRIYVKCNMHVLKYSMKREALTTSGS